MIIMANIIPGVDDYGINLVQLRDTAIAEGKREHAECFEGAITAAIAGDKAWYERICKEIAFLIGNTGMNPLDIGLGHIQKVDACADGTCMD